MLQLRTKYTSNTNSQHISLTWPLVLWTATYMAGILGPEGQSKYGPAKSLSHMHAPQYQLCIILLQ